ncbi:MAG: cation:proton antiporter [Candidatus Cloacimonetes bacterium]|nr:cation:proton antiporter [Candidatus Cloacimonadota bacterium]
MIHILEMIKESFAHHIFFSAGLLLITGYLFGQISEKIKLPMITGYIIAGILIGDSGLKLIGHQNIELLHILSEITLSFIAVIIGGEFSFSKLKLFGKKIIFITLTQMFLTFFAVSFGLLLIGLSSYVAFLLGAIASATAPAASAVIAEKLKAKGEFVDYLHGVVALNDAGTIIIFSLAFSSISRAVMGELELSHSLIHAFSEIVFSLLLGIAGGLAIHYTTAKKKNLNEINILAFGFIFCTTSLAISLHLSSLITNMTIGMLLINLSKKNVKILTSLQPLTAPLYAIFFAFAGAEMDLSVFKGGNILIAGAIFVLLRAFGKYFGVFTSGKLLRVSPQVNKFLGLALLPQAGVSIGLVLFVQGSQIVNNASPQIQFEITEMINIVLMSVFINELTGPPLAKLAILKNMKRK